MMSIRARKRLIAGETAAGRKIEKKSTFTPDSSETTGKITKLFDAAFSPDIKKHLQKSRLGQNLRPKLHKTFQRHLVRACPLTSKLCREKRFLCSFGPQGDRKGRGPKFMAFKFLAGYCGQTKHPGLTSKKSVSCAYS